MIDKPPITFTEFLTLVNTTFNANSELRYGQTIMNVLSEIWSDKYRELTASYKDCYYDNRMVEQTLHILEQDWSHHG